MPSERDRMLAGQPYDPLDGELVDARRAARELCAALNATPPGDTDAQRTILCRLLGRGGDTAWIEPPFHCDYGAHIELGERVFCNFNCIFLDVCPIRIGAHTLIGPGVQILTPLHPMSAMERREREFGKPVEVGEDVWIGGGVVIQAGVHIGPRTVIGAGSVVMRSVPEGVFAAGNPCRVIRAIEG